MENNNDEKNYRLKVYLKKRKIARKVNVVN